jgi:ATP-dependent Clp protease ATP-binding subunit ClpX
VRDAAHEAKLLDDAFVRIQDGPLDGAAALHGAGGEDAATLHDLDDQALVRILKEPKNALTKQYSKLFEMESVHLKFTEEALRGIAREAMKRKSGARGLRAIMENIMLDVMYEMPSQPNIKEVIVSEEVVTRNEPPIIVYSKAAESA